MFLRGSVAWMISLTPAWLNPLNPSFRSRFSRCDPIAPLVLELLRLFAGDRPCLQQPLDSLRIHFPPLSFRERLAEIGEIRKGLHRFHACLFSQLSRERIKIEHRCEVMHARLQKRISVQTAPEPHGAERVLSFEAVVAEIADELFRRQVDIVEGNDSCDRLLHHLRAPSRFTARVESLPALQAKLLPGCDQKRESFCAMSGTCDDRGWPSPIRACPGAPSAPGPRGSGASRTRAPRQTTRRTSGPARGHVSHRRSAGSRPRIQPRRARSVSGGP